MAVDVDQSTLKFKEYFNEIVPFTLEKDEKIKHKYTVEIVRAVFDQSCFEVFKKYELKIHGKTDKSKKSYDRFLC